MILRIRKIVAACLAAGALLGASASASAATEFHTIPGDACEMVIPNTQYIRHYSGRLWVESNAPFSYSSAVCPLPRRIHTSTLSSAWISLYRKASTVQACYIYSEYPQPGGSFMQVSKQTNSSTAGNQEVYFSLGDLTAYNWGYFTAQCNLAPGDILYGVQYGEVVP